MDISGRIAPAGCHVCGRSGGDRGYLDRHSDASIIFEVAQILMDIPSTELVHCPVYQKRISQVQVIGFTTYWSYKDPSPVTWTKQIIKDELLKLTTMDAFKFLKPDLIRKQFNQYFTNLHISKRVVFKLASVVDIMMTSYDHCLNISEHYILSSTLIQSSIQIILNVIYYRLYSMIIWLLGAYEAQEKISTIKLAIKKITNFDTNTRIFEGKLEF